MASDTEPTAMELRRRVGFALVALVALVLGLVGFAGYQPPPGQPNLVRTTADVVYSTLQLFVFNAAPLNSGGPYPVTLEIARFLAPVATLFALAETLRVLLGEQWWRWLAHRQRDHVVVCGEGPAAVLLVRRLAARGPVVLVSGQQSGEIERRRGLYLVRGDPETEPALRAAAVPRAAVLYACAASSATNTSVVLNARRLSQRRLSAYAQVSDGELQTALRARRIGLADDPRFRLDFFALDAIAARVLLDREPAGKGPVALVGGGSFARALLTELGRRRHDDGATRLAVTVVRREGAILGELPAVRGCEVVVQAQLPDHPCSRIYICEQEDEQGLVVGLRAARRHHSDVVICLSRQEAFREAFSAGAPLLDDLYGRLRVFGILDEACHPHLVHRDLLDQLARAIHARYVASLTAQGRTPAGSSSLVPWEQLSPQLQQSNYAQAEDIGRKLHAIGCTIVPATDEPDSFSYREGEVLQLARMEHNRWMAEKTDAGLVPGPDRSAGQHPDLKPWDDLPPGSRAKDIDTIENLPHLLVRAGFHILRIER